MKYRILLRWRMFLRRLGRTRVAAPVVLAMMILMVGSLTMAPSWPTWVVLAVSSSTGLAVTMNWRARVEVEDIRARTHDVAEAVREYSRMQVHYWRQVPWLYLHNEGLDGYQDNAHVVYGWGYWETQRADTFGGRSPVSVDLSTGELVWTFSIHDIEKGPKPASDDELVRMAGDLNRYLNAESLVRSLEHWIAEGQSRYASKTKEELDTWHARQREKYGIERVFTREQ